ncbi:hypothetical protein CYLTODRAFT_425979 [Cylindrobasidium torrendii FP15055 ss-10]|uniref:Uncharacterized protein n=1 Tax=Cylindrobasidium torrendii FP15055 ss-10 TaxID=1314674 RepID=A0A0D7B042_9AGAR|nr:hypothetical protein CYLTODRAFT_425979 [Cylindrobasidium torrendii FP15055 ss-10]
MLPSRLPDIWELPPQRACTVDSTAVITTTKLETALGRLSRQAFQYERQMRDLEGKLTENLSNFRAIDSLLQEAFTVLRHNSRRADKAASSQIPEIKAELDDAMEALDALSDTLPTIRTQVADIRSVYDSGRNKAQILVADLTWLNTEFYERWRTIIFTSTSPVSWRWKTFMRFLFAVLFIMCFWISWIALMGAYRAYRHKLVWGERLMS